MNSSSTSPEARLSLRDMCVLAVMGALTFGAQVAMAGLPNIEPVTLLLMCCTLVYGAKALYPCYIFVALEGLVYGFGLWFVGYLYVWAVLIFTTLALRRSGSYLLLTAAAALFGLLFGALYALSYLFIGGWEMAFSWWVAGIPFDLIHCAANAAICGALLKPLTAVLKRLAAA